MRNKKPLPILTNIEITDIASEGQAIARVDEMVVFVPFVVPGDIVDLQIVKKKKNYAQARAVRFEKFSENRTLPLCPHFGICGGCKWQILPYVEQLHFKQQQVVDNLTRIGKIPLPEIDNICGSKKTEYYRNKLEFTFSNRKWLTDVSARQTEENMNAVGFHIPTMFDKVLDIEKCILQDDISNKIRNEVRRYAFEKQLTFFDIKKQEGFLRTMIIRTSTTGDLMVIMVFFYEDIIAQNALLQHITDSFPQITSLLYIINSKANDTITDQKVNIFKGNDYIFEQMEGLKFKIGAKSFFQTNTHQAYELYKIVKNFAQLTDNELVYDLYTGTGTIANFIARYCRQVIGIEYVVEAISDAKENSGINGIENTIFYAGDIKNILNQDFITANGKPDVIITDPPRAGMHSDVVAAILAAEPQRIVYVSCNPATQARDLNFLAQKYRVAKVQPVDMFPHTHHVENVVLMEM
ncbi:MAG: 23S rRNA (uracil(1939)-C(5))-methyltransferase RlmD [Paludibacter sp.]|nr:23S rRNA (uracil(1939)-C(5))-methyltransferase RlmD [Paludibacter sp.]